MEFIELVKKRHSTRSYQDRKVEREKIKKCVEAARAAPSACNSQPWKFIAVDDFELKNKLANAAFLAGTNLNKFLLESPVIVAVVEERANMSSRVGGLIKSKDFRLVDIGIATEHFCLQATEEGLGTCILGWFDEKAVKKYLNIPKFKKVPLLISLGYEKNGGKHMKIRKSIEDILNFNTYK